MVSSCPEDWDGVLDLASGKFLADNFLSAVFIRIIASIWMTLSFAPNFKVGIAFCNFLVIFYTKNFALFCCRQHKYLADLYRGTSLSFLSRHCFTEESITHYALISRHETTFLLCCK